MAKDYSKIATEESVKKTTDALELNGFTVVAVDNLAAANVKVKELIPVGSEVFTATSVTLTAAGLEKELNESGNYVSARAKFGPLYGQEDKVLLMRQLSSASDYAVGSIHAVTEDGQLLVASATGSQLPNYAYGANHVIFVVGTQKIVTDLGEAFERLETYTFPLENERAKKVYGSGSVISKILLFKNDPSHRITIILVNENVGY
ncbi:MAG: lactate utilization protein [Candidatus Saccharimonadales bacterium]